ncbi:MAG: histidine-type phosphatase [Bacteroidaceae bacterium]|nr:histidine-type phosphatase [Bacteroidaceae bacterium]
MKHLLLIFFSVCLSTNALAQTSAREEIAANPYLCGSNHLDYDNYPATAALTKTPKGYEPYYLTHYGRHGSRWLLDEEDYMGTIETLRKAKAQGKITNKGNEVLAQLEKFYPCTIKRLGDLTTVGERQHHGIGRRLAEHFPEIFKKKGIHIDARSTIVIRCILSMEAECEELAAANPTIHFHNDVSQAFQYYLNAPWSKSLRESNRKRGDTLAPLRDKWTKPERLMGVLFNDPQWVADSLRAGSVMRHLFDIASNMQSHEGAPDLLKLFTAEELYDQWRIRNVDWYLGYGHAPQTDGIMPFSQARLLKNIIQTADTVQQVQATLRFGHEVCVMPLACLLELGQSGARVDNLEELDKVWRNYNIFPMGCNIQLIFYRPKKGKSGDILVKALLNEREQTLPIPSDNYPYYRWADLRAYYLKKLADFEAQSN